MTFQKKGYELVKGALNSQTVELLNTEFKILREMKHIDNHNIKDVSGDKQVDNAFCVYGPIGSEASLLLLKPIIEKVVGKKLNPTYSYVRIYYKNSFLSPHIDRESCQYSATLCIQNDTKPWEIWFEKRGGGITSFALEPGDLLVYRGNELIHWRDPYEYEEQVQIFLHYIEADGVYKNYIYDTRPYLGFHHSSRKRID